MPEEVQWAYPTVGTLGTLTEPAREHPGGDTVCPDQVVSGQLPRESQPRSTPEEIPWTYPKRLI